MTTQKVVAITGGTGFVGRALIERLLATHAVRALIRTPDERTGAWQRRGCELVVGSLEQPGALADLVRGADVVLHCAATMGKSDAALSHRVNVVGTEDLARAALDADVRRFIYVSSISVYAATRKPDGVITEVVPPDRVDRLNHYGRTKHEGELRVRALSSALGLSYTILRPTNIYGAGSGPWFHQFERMLQRFPLALGDIPIDVVHLDDVVDAMVLAAYCDAAANETFHIGHEMLKLNEFICRVGRVIGRSARTLPPRLDRRVRWAVDTLYRTVTRRHMSMSLVHPVWYPHGKAQAAFQYAPQVGIDDGFARIALWYGRRSLPPKNLPEGGSDLAAVPLARWDRTKYP